MKKTLACAAALITALSFLGGCGGNKPDNAVSSPYFTDFAAWKDIEKSTVVAKLKNGEFPDKFNITFGDFGSEYLYLLTSYNIDDDMTDENIGICEDYRRQIITFLTFERIFLYVAEKDYGITEATLTDAQKKEIREYADTVLENWKSTYYSKAVDIYGEELSQAELEKNAEQLLNEDLERCGLTSDVFYKWEYSAYVQELVIAEINKTAVITDSDVDEAYDDNYKDALEAYKMDTRGYEQSALYQALYLPEGTRKSEHIYVAYSSEDADKIAAAYEAGDSADELIKAAAENIADKLSDVETRLGSGTDFRTLQSEYSPESEGEFIIIPDTELYYPEYRDALYALKSVGDVSEAVPCDTGVYYIMYMGEAKITEEDTKAVKDELRDYLTETKQDQVQSEKYAEWFDLYEYDIDYELLKLEDDSSDTVISNDGDYDEDYGEYYDNDYNNDNSYNYNDDLTDIDMFIEGVYE